MNGEYHVSLPPTRILAHSLVCPPSFYPNYLAFFHRLISTPPPPTSPYYGRPSSVVPVIEQYLLGGEGQMLVRAVSGAIHPLIHIGHGVEFELDSVVAEGETSMI